MTLSGWLPWALLSALFAALTAIFAKVGIEAIESDFATLLRTVVVALTLGALIYATGKWQSPSRPARVARHRPGGRRRAVAEPPRRPVSTAIIVLVVLSALEVLILYALIVLDSPLSPAVQRALHSPLGVIGVVLSVLAVLCAAMGVFLLYARKRDEHERSRGGSP